MIHVASCHGLNSGGSEGITTTISHDIACHINWHSGLIKLSFLFSIFSSSIILFSHLHRLWRFRHPHCFHSLVSFYCRNLWGLWTTFYCVGFSGLDLREPRATTSVLSPFIQQQQLRDFWSNFAIIFHLIKSTLFSFFVLFARPNVAALRSLLTVLYILVFTKEKKFMMHVVITVGN